jgi:3-hydroxyacyl-CoA dehydrogenase
MAKTMHRELKDNRYSPPALLRRLVLNGHLGKKTGMGIYDYSPRPSTDGGAPTPPENPGLWPEDTTTRLGA